MTSEYWQGKTSTPVLRYMESMTELRDRMNSMIYRFERAKTYVYLHNLLLTFLLIDAPKDVQEAAATYNATGEVLERFFGAEGLASREKKVCQTIFSVTLASILGQLDYKFLAKQTASYNRLDKLLTQHEKSLDVLKKHIESRTPKTKLLKAR